MRYQRERGKKILVPNYVHIQPGQENSEKNRKRNQKIKKPLSGIIFSQTGLDRPRMRKVPNSDHTRPGQEI